MGRYCAVPATRDRPICRRNAGLCCKNTSLAATHGGDPMTWLWLLLGVWRSWLGGGIGKDFAKPVQLPAVALLAVAASWHHPIYIMAVNAAMVIILARGYGHGPMLR